MVAAPLISGGERYEQVTLTMPGSVTLSSAGIQFTPVRETPPVMAGHFLSSDRLLNRIWYAGAYTLNLNQMTPGTLTTNGQVNQLHLLLDGAKRDRAVWSGDQGISELTDFYVSDPAYARDSLMLLLTHPASNANFLSPTAGDASQPGPLPGACSPNPMGVCVTWSASYSIVVMPALYNYYRYSGDLGFVRQHWQAVVRQMQWDAQQVDANGLFAVSGSPGDGTDWNLESPSGEVTYVNAVYVEALQSAAKLAAALGQTAEATEWSAAAIKVTHAVNRILWNAKTGAYDPTDTIRGPVVQDANVMAILSGIATERQARSITTVLARALATRYGPIVATPDATGYIRDISPYMGSFNVLADFASGNESAALALMRQEWGFMISHDPGGVDWERIEQNGVPAGTSGSLMLADSSAHAWATGPTPAMSQYILGVAPATPGYATWTVAPQPGDLRWAQGVVPTPHGAIAVRWRRSGRRSFVLTVTAPPGTAGTVQIPLLDRTGAIARQGRIVWAHGRPALGVRARRVSNSVLFARAAGRATYASVR
jgi:alpha-L-rhamnosidase